jgi:hypothetical protein
MDKISQAIDVINQSFAESATKQDNGSFSKLSILLSEFEDGLREFVQESTKDQIQKVIQKLNIGQALAPEDLATVRLWIVGDAEYYANVENDFNKWNDELKRLIQEINKLKNAKLDIKSASTLRALLTDAMRTAGSISFFLQQKERVERFTSSVNELDADERLMLTQILLSKFKSGQY